MTKIINFEGRRYKVTRILLVMGDGDTQQNIADTLTEFWNYEILRTRMIQFKTDQHRNNEIYMYLRTVAPAEIGDDAQIELWRANNKSQYLETIWEGNYGQIPSTANRGNINYIVVPTSEVRLIEGERVIAMLEDDEQIVIANSDLELRAEELLEFRY